MLLKAIVSRYFNEPISTIDKFSIHELQKWRAAALWIVSEIDLKPFEMKK
jgi:hypothetical protein